jgi:hypothetical protein
MRHVLVLCAATVTIVALVAATRDEYAEPIPVAMGTIYSTNSGDSLDVVAGRGDRPGSICFNVGGFHYGSGISCTDEQAASATGSYVVALPDAGRGPTYVVGVLPAGSIGATVAAGGEERRADTRGRWFLAELPEIDRRQALDVSVDYYT